MGVKKVSFWTGVFIVAVVILRMAIGCHFLYEGLWKMDPANGFSAKGFLGIAKGPTAELYYKMLPDLTGVERLQMAEAVEGEMVDGKFVAGQSQGWTLPVFETAWFKYYDKYLAKYGLDQESAAEQRKKTDAVFNQYIGSLRECTLEQRDAIRELMGSRKRFEAKQRLKTDGAEHQKVWDWDTKLKLRNEGDAMASVPEKMGANMQLALWDELTPQQKALGELPPIAYGSNYIPGISFIQKIPVIKEFAVPSRMGLLDLCVTIGLSAIGLCLILGLCTRLAALGGAIFMVNVVLTQFPWPTVYPHAPEVVGHSMVVSKDTVELLALILLIILPAGRWGGLDWFLWNCGGKQLVRLYRGKKDPLTPEITSETLGPASDEANA
ncbi:MAG: DoxX family protein [Thermoguttaceae bacterium]|nr:DoxX family protein [Thermoguttaceae bacterium]